jgi:4-hydroxyphenylpyruvate dioxygenase
MTTVGTERPTEQAGPSPAPPALRGIDHVEWWVGNARTFTAFLEASFGFRPVAYAGPETGVDDRVSHVVEQGSIRFLVSGALSPESPIAEHVRVHGDGVHDVAFQVDDVATAHASSVQRGALDGRPPRAEEDEHGTLHQAAIRTYGETLHSFVDRSGYDGVFAPGFTVSPLASEAGSAGASSGVAPVGLSHVDHIVGNVEPGQMSRWVEYYERVLGLEQFVHFGADQIATEYTALVSTVMWNGGSVVLPINEPAEGRRKSQIQEYLDYYGSPGVQHLALHTADIIAAVRSMRARGVRFLSVPPEYYDDARQRMAGVDLPWDDLSELGILVDRDEDGHLLQIFTEPLCDRPTVFFEIIQRAGAKGFGEGNFKALFEAIERAQAARGNL